MVFKVTIAIDGMVPAQPLGPMVFQWFLVSQPLVTMFFNGCQPMVQRCDGNDTSFRSIVKASMLMFNGRMIQSKKEKNRKKKRRHTIGRRKTLKVYLLKEGSISGCWRQCWKVLTRKQCCWKKVKTTDTKEGRTWTRKRLRSSYLSTGNSRWRM